MNKLSKYYNVDALKFEHITISWLKEFESALSKNGLSVNAISIHLRNIRAVYNEAMEIINKYRGKSQLLNPLDRYSNYKDFMRRMNRALQQIGEYEMVANGAQNPDKVKRNKKKITPLHPDLTTYWARHTMATLMAELDLSKETIAKVLGHADNDVTSIYIKFDNRKIDAAMRRVIDFVNEKQ